MGINADVIRFLTVRVEELETEPSVQMRKQDRDERGDRGDRGGFGGGRGGPPRGGRGGFGRRREGGSTFRSRPPREGGDRPPSDGRPWSASPTRRRGTARASSAPRYNTWFGGLTHG